ILNSKNMSPSKLIPVDVLGKEYKITGKRNIPSNLDNNKNKQKLNNPKPRKVLTLKSSEVRMDYEQ
ncbi:9905_t:CDS:1, partial [Cetraspora pellucida]